MSILSESVETAAATAPEIVLPAADRIAAWMVAPASARVLPPAPGSPAATIAMAPMAGARPGRTSRQRGRSRPRASRLLTVPTGNEGLRARSWVSPSRSQSTIGSRNARAAGRAPRERSTRNHRHDLHVLKTPLARRPCAHAAHVRRCRPGTRRRAVGHTVKPARHRFAAADRTSPTHQHQKRSLERVAHPRDRKEAPADAEHHRAMPLDQNREGRLRRRTLPRQTVPAILHPSIRRSFRLKSVRTCPRIVPSPFFVISRPSVVVGAPR